MTDPQKTKKEPQGMKAPLRTWPQRLMPQLETALELRVVQYLSVLLLVVVVALLVAPSFGGESMADRLIVGARAETNIKATRNFQHEMSEAQLTRRRDEVESKVDPVFDHQADLTSVLLSRINTAFEAVKVSPAHDTGSAQAPATSDKFVRPRPKAPHAGDLRQIFADALQTEISAETFHQLRRTKFSPEVRGSIGVLVGLAMSEYVISHRGALEPFKERSVSVRHLVGGTPSRRGEERLGSLGRIKDLQAVREQIRQQVAVHGVKLKSQVRDAVVDLVESLIVPNFMFNPVETSRRIQRARLSIKNRPVSFVKGQILVRDGDPITEEHVRILRAMDQGREGISAWQIVLGLALLALLMVVSSYRFAHRQFSRFYRNRRDVALMGLLMVGMFALTKGVLTVGATNSSQFSLFPYLLPVASGAMLVRLLVTPEAAAMFAVMLATFCGLMLDRSLPLSLMYLIGGLVGAYGATEIQSRSAVLRAGLLSGLFAAGVALCFGLLGGEIPLNQLLYTVLAAVAGGMLAAFATLALLPLIEWLFAYTTDITLLELANLNHPLLRELMLRAPGTYHHSMVVGSLAEAGCEAIGANGLLARVASNYHDVGKVKNAAYFAENFRPGENPHNRLKPSMSALIIRNHVKDTIEMLREHGIPDLVIDTGSQHHGTSLIAFFYHKSVEQKEQDEEIREEDYRYPGPKPQSREAGVIMLADGVEAAARSLADPTDDRLRSVVQRIINTQFADGQLDQCDLTLRDLHLIARAFLVVLRGIHARRPSYPWQRDDGHRDRKGKQSTKVSSKGRRPSGNQSAVNRDSEDGASDEPKQQTASSKPASGQRGEGASGDRDEGSTEEESATDIKRLGLN